MSNVPDSISIEELARLWVSKLTPSQKVIAMQVLRELREQQTLNPQSQRQDDCNSLN